MTGEGIYYAVATGLLAGRAAVSALAADGGSSAGGRHRRAVRGLLSGHLRDITLAGRLVSVPSVVRAGVRAAARDQRVFDVLVELGLARGRLTPSVLGALAQQLLPRRRHQAPG